MAMNQMEGVDLVEIPDYYRAKELSEHIIVWRGLVAILGDELDVSKQDLCLGWLLPVKWFSLQSVPEKSEKAKCM